MESVDLTTPIVEGLLPSFVAFPFIMAGYVFKIGIVSMATLPWWSLLAAVATVDNLIDYFFLFTIGLISKKIAGIFIWLINLALLPFTVLGWIQRLVYEVFALPIDGWLVFLGNGCFMRFGDYCWLEARGKRSLRNYLDIPYFFDTDGSLGDLLSSLMVPPTIETQADIFRVRRANRRYLTDQIPVWRTFNEVVDTAIEHFDF